MDIIRWERQDRSVLTVILETAEGYILSVTDLDSGERLVGPRLARINPDKLASYGFKAKRRAA